MNDERYTWQLKEKIEDKKVDGIANSCVGVFDALIAGAGATGFVLLIRLNPNVWEFLAALAGLAVFDLFGVLAGIRFEEAHKSFKEAKCLKRELK